MSDERPAVDSAAVQRAVRVAQLVTSSRRAQTGLSIHEAENLGRVTLALNMVANGAGDLLLAIDQPYDPANDEQAAAYAASVTAAQQDLASMLLALGFIVEKENGDGPEG